MRGYNAAALGFRYDFSWKTLHLQQTVGVGM
jgi:hypothetical protein